MVKFTPGDATLGVVIHALAELCSSIPATASTKGASDEIGYPSTSGGGAPEISLEGGQPGDCKGEKSLRELGRLLASLAGQSNQPHPTIILLII